MLAANAATEAELNGRNPYEIQVNTKLLAKALALTSANSPGRNPYEIQVNTKADRIRQNFGEIPCRTCRNPYEIQVNTKWTKNCLRNTSQR